jgi:hypothetical protein
MSGEPASYCMYASADEYMMQAITHSFPGYGS